MTDKELVDKLSHPAPEKEAGPAFNDLSDDMVVEPAIVPIDHPKRSSMWTKICGFEGDLDFDGVSSPTMSPF